jgi:hypothetical protein
MTAAANDENGAACSVAISQPDSAFVRWRLPGGPASGP